MFNLKATNRKPLMESVPEDLLDKMRAIETGRWSVNDVLEMQVDEEDVGETSTAASVGSGVSSKLGMARPVHPYEKLKKAYEEYLSASNKKHGKKTIKEFCEKTSPGNDVIIPGFMKYLGV